MTSLAADLRRAADASVVAEDHGFKLDPWQADVLRSDAKRMALVCSRQSGKTTAMALRIAHHGTFTPGATLAITAPTEKQAKEVLLRAKTHARKLGNVESDTALSIRFENGARVLAMPATEKSARGLSLDGLYIDEAARVPDDEYTALRPMVIATGGIILAASTPYGRRGWFYEAVHSATRGISDWQVYRVPWWDVPRLDEADIAIERREMTAEAFAAEYECQFVSQNGSYMFAGLLDRVSQPGPALNIAADLMHKRKGTTPRERTST